MTIKYLEEVMKGFDQQKALKPVDVRFEECSGKPLRIAIVIMSGERVPVVSLSDIADYLNHPIRNREFIF